MEKWFDPTVYMQNKLAQMQATDPAYAMSDLVAAFAKAGFVGPEGYFQHFQQFGAAEEVAPNAYFNANEYYAAKAAQFYGDKFDGSELQIAQVKTLINKEGMNAWTHYQQFGSAEGVNPSNAFDASDYCAAKAAAMIKAGQKAPDGTDWTAEKIAKAIDDAGMSVLEHYLTYAGTGEGEVAAGSTYPVSEDEQVVLPNPGKTVVVDGSATTYTGTAGDDKFYLKHASELHEYNTLDGGEGNDTLILDGQDLGGATIRNIENLVVNGGHGDYDMSLFATSFTLKGGSAELTNVTDQKLVVSGTTSHTASPISTLTVNMAAGQASVDLASQNLAADHTFTLKGDSLTSVKLAMDEGTHNVTFTGSTAKVTDLAVTATVSEAENGKANVNASALTNLANVTVAGAGAVKLTVDTASPKSALKAVDATANTGGVEVDLSDAKLAKVAFTGGDGDDSLTLGNSAAAHTLGAGDDTLNYTAALGVGGSVAGGKGTDTIVVANANLANLKTDFANITGFEALTVTSLLADDINMADYAGIDHLTLQAGIAASKQIQNMQSGSTLELTANAVNSFEVVVAGANKATDDVLNIVLSGDETLAANTVTVKEVETINIVADDSDDNASATHTMTLTADKATTVKVSGDAGLTLTLMGSEAVKTIDASKSTGDVTISDALKGVTFTGGAGNDVVELGAGNTVTGGAGKDIFNIKLNTAVNDRSVITDFGAGDTITMGTVANGSGTGNALGDALVVNDPKATLDDYVNAATQTTGVAWFQYEGNTYVVVNDATAGFDASADYIVQLSGSVGLSDAVMANGSLTLGA